MAIQHRRGNYADLDTSRLVQGEPFVTLDTVDGEYYVGIAIGPSNVVRLASRDDLTNIKTDCQTYADNASNSASAAAASELNAATSEENAEAWAIGERGGLPVPSGDATYENNSKYYAGVAESYWNAIDTAVSLVEPVVTINFTTGELEFSGSQWVFYIDQVTGNLMWNIVTH